MSSTHIQITPNLIIAREHFEKMKQNILSLQATPEGTQIWYEFDNIYCYKEVDLPIASVVQIFGLEGKIGSPDKGISISEALYKL